MKLPLAALAGLAALAACQVKTDPSVENQFQRTEALIQNTANALENSAEVSTRAAANEIEAQANGFENRVDAVDRAVTGGEGNTVHHATTSRAGPGRHPVR
jgi:HAMP domain-containing protein